ncbi:MAG: aldo/keto reductase [Dongiaceae bacterium]
MRYKIFGRRTGLRVSEVALGTGNFGTGWGHGAEPADSRKIFDLYAEAGGNFIDTADGYQMGEAEAQLGDLLATSRDDFVLATKFTLGSAGKGGISVTGNNRKSMIHALEASLKRLKTDRIDLYWAHFDDGVTPMEEILRGFDDLVRGGKILYAGLSNFPAWRIARTDLLAELRGTTPIVGVQVEYSLAERSADREMLPMIEALGLGGTFWSPLGGGFLTGKYRHGKDGRLSAFGGHLIHTETDAQKTAILDTVLAVAGEIGMAPLQVAIAWLHEKARRSTTSLIPILGARSVEQLQPTLAALDVTLTPAQVTRLDEVSAVKLGVPHEAIQDVVPRMFGEQQNLVDLPAVPVA